MHNEEMDYTDAKQLRSKAEEQLKKKDKRVEDVVAEIDSKKLLHELQVHQIELEMQNEELRLAYVTAETALKKYTISTILLLWAILLLITTPTSMS